MSDEILQIDLSAEDAEEETGFVWPPRNMAPTPEEPWYCSGTYSDDPLNVSPEGYVYGQTQRFVRWPRKFWWDGEVYGEVECENQTTSIDLLPTGRPCGDIWRVLSHYDNSTDEYVWDFYVWDGEGWARMVRYEDVDAVSELPYPGRRFGAYHHVIERNVLCFWDGYKLRRPPHSGLYNDEPELHLPPGFVLSLTADVRMRFASPKELHLEPVKGGSGEVTVNGERIRAEPTSVVFSHLAVLNWDGQEKQIIPGYAEPDTEYYVYLANTLDEAFVVDALPGDATHNPTPAWDYRGKLFLSQTSPQNRYWSLQGSGRNALLAGKIQTDQTAASDGGPLFVRELNLSLISRRASLPEAFRDYSDYQVAFTDQNTLTLQQSDGSHGQIAIAGTLEYLGSDYLIERTAAWIVWDPELPGRVERRTDALQPNALYYLYLAGDVDAFNFNAINSDTSRPWQQEDTGAEDHYDPTLDLRLRPFLSTKDPDHGRLSEEWPGFYTRHIGQVTTDASGCFRPARNLSAIRQLTLNPTDLDGLAEIRHQLASATQFMVCSMRGTSGIVNVGGEPVETYEEVDPNVHRVANSDPIYTYTGDYENPLSDSGEIIADRPKESLHVYLANSRALWGTLAGRLFVSDSVPVDGYLSRNWPGNQARWISTIIPDNDGKFTGMYVSETIAPERVRINDAGASPIEVWSSGKCAAEISALWAALGQEWDNWEELWNQQCNNGIAGILTWDAERRIRFTPLLGSALSVAFPDLAGDQIPAAGITYWWTEWSPYSPYAIRYVYLAINVDATPKVVLAPRDDPPTEQNGAMQYFYIGGTHPWGVLVGYLTVDEDMKLGGDHSVYGLFNQSERVYAANGGPGTVHLAENALIVPPGKLATLVPVGSAQASFWANGIGKCWTAVNSYPASQSCSYDGPGGVHVEGSLWSTRSHATDIIPEGGYTATDLWCAVQAAVTQCDCPSGCSVVWDACAQNLTFTLEGS